VFSLFSLPFFLAPDAMLAAPNLPKLSRNWPLVAIAGAAGFALGIALFVLCGASWIVAMLTQTSTPVGALVIGLPFRVRRGGDRRFVRQ
jgi:uncharacterized membrane protein YedE/YeeE